MHKNEVILITGTRKGIGRYLAEYYAQKGYRVIGCSRGPIDYELENYDHFCLDVCEEENVKEMLLEIRRVHNRLDVLINNAGVASMDYILITPAKTVRDVLNTNVTGTFVVCREALKLMKKNRYGRIVNISSIHVPLSTVGSSIYGASKAAIEQFSKVLAKESRPFVTVNVLGLSFVNDTGMVKNVSEDTVLKTLEHTICRAPLNLEDVSHAMDFLISEESEMVTGQTLYLGGV